MFFVFPIKAVSSSQAYPTRKQGGRYLSPQGKEFKKEVGYLALKDKPKDFECSLDNFEVVVHFFFRDNRRRDIDDYFKLLLDSLTGIIWQDDSQIMKLTGYKTQGVEDAISIEIKKIGEI